MQIQQNVTLAPYSTMKLGGAAAFLAVVTTEAELLEALVFAQENNLSIHVVGEGSNSIFSDNGFNGLVIVNKILGIEELIEDGDLTLNVGAGENWDSVVKLSVDKGYLDIAALSLIPGTTGAAPVQNIGAYGQQVSDSIVSVRAYEVARKSFVVIAQEDCDFSYRHSRFNTLDKNKFIITSIKMRLNRKNIEPPFYVDVERYFEKHGINQNNITPLQLREAVSTVRVIKLPDPGTVANCGSFFKNPIVTQEKFNELIKEFPELKAHQTDDGNLKLYGAQLIELCGLKDFHDKATGMATWKNQALVLVNESAHSTADLLKFKQKIIETVQQKFGITLIQEPEFVELV